MATAPDREAAIQLAITERIVSLQFNGEPHSLVYSCQCYPLCELTPDEVLKRQGCPWCTVHVVWPDGSSFRKEPGRA